MINNTIFSFLNLFNFYFIKKLIMILLPKIIQFYFAILLIQNLSY